MRRLPLLAVLALAACSGDGQPFAFGGAEPVDPVPEPGAVIPEAVAGNLGAAAFVPPSGAEPDGSLRVQVTALDSTPFVVEYARNPALDVEGYAAYSVQEDPLDRLFVGLGAQSADGSMEGVLAVSGPQFNTYFGGVNYERLTDYSPHVPTQPGGGLVSYAGDYVGMLNGSAPGGGALLPLPPGTDPALVPGQPARVTGEVFLNADFTDNSVNGVIYDREFADAGVTGLTLADVVLVPADIDADGRFAGAAEDPALEGIGEYAGAFGGTGATAVAGGVRLTGDFIPEADSEEEYGLFVLDQCGQPGDAAVCDGVDP